MSTSLAPNPAELTAILEPLIRRIVREEIEQLAHVFYLEADSPLYHDLQDILERKASGRIRLHNAEEVWG